MNELYGPGPGSWLIDKFQPLCNYKRKDYE